MLRMKFWLYLLMMMVNMSLHAISKDRLLELLSPKSIQSPFKYPIGIKVIPSSQANAEVMICFHGFGGSNYIADILRSHAAIHEHLVSFNFPDYNIFATGYDLSKIAYGTVQELLPGIYVIKKCVIDGNMSAINLYGFSAGAGAIVNILATLNSSRFDKELQQIGITQEDKEKMLAAIQKGYIIFNCPLRSVEEIIDYRGSSPDLDFMAKRYRDNKLRPIDSLKGLEKLKLNVLVHFQVPDNILSNRDDQLFIQQLREYNKGNTCVVIGNDGGHNVYHASLWKIYPEFMAGQCQNKTIDLLRK